MAIQTYFHHVWRLKWPLVATHAVVVLATFALITPLVTGALRLGLDLSGQPALSDQDIAFFLLSPLGLLVGLAVGSLVLTAAVIELSAMLWVLAMAEHGRGQWGIGALRAVAMRLPRMLRFAAHLIVRVVAIAAPFAGAVVAIAFLRLTEFDINYYLTERPPELRNTILMCAPILALGAVVLISRLLSWVMALPLILFEGVKPRNAFSASAALTHNNRRGLLGLFGLWAAITFAIGLSVTLLAGGLAQIADLFQTRSLTALVIILGVVLVVWALMLTLATTLTRAGFAALVLDRYRHYGGSFSGVKLAEPGLPGNKMRQVAVAGVFIVGIAGLLGVMLIESFRPVDQVEIIAHRGAAGLRPENTMAAFEHAIVEKADWIELDVQESGDGEIIVAHDSDFMKIAGNPVKVWDVTRAELDTIDIGSFFGPEYADQRTPLLSDVLELAKGRVKVLIELKYYGHNIELEQKVADLVEAADMTDHIAIMSLDPSGVARMQALRPDWHVGLLAATAVGNLSRLDVSFLAVKTSLATPSLVRSANKAGKPLSVWTVNDAVGMSQMMSRGVDGLITDYPGRARDVMETRAEMNTGERPLLELADLLGLKIHLPTRDTEGA